MDWHFQFPILFVPDESVSALIRISGLDLSNQGLSGNPRSHTEGVRVA